MRTVVTVCRGSVRTVRKVSESVRNARTVGAISFTAMAQAEKLSETVRKVSGVNVRIARARGGQALQGKYPKLSESVRSASTGRRAAFTAMARFGADMATRHRWIRRLMFTLCAYVNRQGRRDIHVPELHGLRIAGPPDTRELTRGRCGHLDASIGSCQSKLEHTTRYQL